MNSAVLVHQVFWAAQKDCGEHRVAARSAMIPPVARSRSEYCAATVQLVPQRNIGGFPTRSFQPAKPLLLNISPVIMDATLDYRGAAWEWSISWPICSQLVSSEDHRDALPSMDQAQGYPIHTLAIPVEQTQVILSAHQSDCTIRTRFNTFIQSADRSFGIGSSPQEQALPGIESPYSVGNTHATIQGLASLRKLQKILHVSQLTRTGCGDLYLRDGVATCSNKSAHAVHVSHTNSWYEHDEESLAHVQTDHQLVWSQTTTNHARRHLSPELQDPELAKCAMLVDIRPRCFDHGCGGRCFSSIDNYRRHLREKSGVWRARCCFCMTEFSRRSNRDKHMTDGRCKGLLALAQTSSG